MLFEPGLMLFGTRPVCVSIPGVARLLIKVC